MPLDNTQRQEAQRQPQAYDFTPEILREYDIRGQIGKNLGPDDAYALGTAFGTYIRRKGGTTVCVGYDGRHSSPELADALIQGLIATGIQVDKVGLGPTPMLYFAVKDRMADGGVMITGSHNPPDYNGFKMMLQSGPVFGEIIQELGDIAAAGTFETGDGAVRKIDIKDTYIERILRDFNTPQKELAIAWDCGNGAAGELVQRLTAKLPGRHILLFEDIDGDFPNHHPDPTVDDNMQDLIKTVKENACDLGIAFDGDGDRIGVVDEQGNILRCDILLAIYAAGVLEEHPGAPVIGDVKCSQAMFDEIGRLGGQPVMWKTGHSLIKAKMAETKAPLAGELSGHIFFADKYYGFDDGLYCAIRLLNEAGETEGPFSSLMNEIPNLYSTSEVRLEVEESDKFAIIDRISEKLSANVEADYEVIDIDGVRLVNEDGWWLLRASNTQNVLVSRAEAKSPEGLERLKAMVQDAVRDEGYTLVFKD